jgi:hypothetical protein
MPMLLPPKLERLSQSEDNGSRHKPSSIIGQLPRVDLIYRKSDAIIRREALASGADLWPPLLLTVLATSVASLADTRTISQLEAEGNCLAARPRR